MNPWLTLTARRYEAANRQALGWMLARAPAGPFLDTKVNPLSGADYGPQDGQRGPGWVYGWIQGRGLEALVSFARDLAETDPALSARLLARARPLYAALDGLVARDGHGAFLYRDGRPVRPGSGDPQSVAGAVFTYSDAFFAKGLLAAAALLAPQDAPRQLAYLMQVIAAIEDGRFQMDEAGAIGPDSVSAEPDDFGPRMILLGAAGLLHRLGLGAHADFADRFIDTILTRHDDPATGLLWTIPGEDRRNPGHSVEFVGFALDHLRHRPADPGLTRRLAALLSRTLDLSLTGPGIALFITGDGRPASPYHPWWSLPEAIRACALAQEAGADLLAHWKTAERLFFGNFWQPRHGYAFQTVAADLLCCPNTRSGGRPDAEQARIPAGPVDYVPATPDLDPGYHTALSLHAAALAARRLAGLTQRRPHGLG